MSFLHRNKKQKSAKNTKSANNQAQKPKKKINKFWRVALVVLFVLIIVGTSLAGYIVSSSSKAFEKGLGGGTALIKTIVGQKEMIKGEENDRVNVLLMGMGGANHPGGLLTDSIMVLSIKPSTNQMALISIPRDLEITISGEGEAKINSALASNYNQYLAKNCTKKNQVSCTEDALISGANYETQTISSVVGIPIDYYILADFSGFAKIIDDLGGIDVYVDKTLYDPLFPDQAMKGYDPFKITEGQHHLDGATALKYARSRETTSDFDRAARQQKILQAVKDKALKLGILANPTKVIDLISTLGNSIHTNFTPSELKTFVDLTKNIDKSNINSKVFTTGATGELEDYNNGTYYLRPKGGNFDKIKAIVSNIFDAAYQNREQATVSIYYNAKNLATATTLSKTLEADGYDVYYMGQSKTTIGATSFIDYTGGNKPNTTKFIGSMLGVTAVEQAKPKATSVDLTISIGPDYSPQK